MITVRAGTDKCELCGVVAELRPYGPGNAFICYGCMKRDEPACAKRFFALLDEGLTIDARRPQGEPAIVRPLQEPSP